MNKAQENAIKEFSRHYEVGSTALHEFILKWMDIDPNPDPVYIVLLSENLSYNKEINRFDSLEAANNFLLNTIRNCFYLPMDKLIKFENNDTLTIERTVDGKTDIFHYTIIEAKDE